MMIMEDCARLVEDRVTTRDNVALIISRKGSSPNLFFSCGDWDNGVTRFLFLMWCNFPDNSRLRWEALKFQFLGR